MNSQTLDRIGRLGASARLLGGEWVAFRLREVGRHKLGFIERATPVQRWQDIAEEVGEPNGLPLAPRFLQTWLGANYSNAQRIEVSERITRLADGEFPVFGRWVGPDGWHHDPVGEVRYQPDLHWTKVAVPTGADVKRIWEPSRFSWSFDLVRSHLIDPADGAADLFWDLLDDWMLHNPPNVGINWACGQEASMRLLAAAIAAEMMPDALSEQRLYQLQRLALATGQRVEANIGYARSQRNNHHLSEAVGLVTAAYLCPNSEHSERWRSRGFEHATEVAEKLIFADGGSSQYSLNYHRVFLHDFCGLHLVAAGLGEQLPEPITAAFERATDFLVSVIEPYSGQVPTIGQDDGANLLPWSAGPHRYMRPDADLCLTMQERSSICVTPTDQEPAAWVGETRPLVEIDPPDGPQANYFSDFGLVVMTLDPWRVYLRSGTTAYRPSQDDQLHCDVWFAGKNLAFDPGTYTYHPRPGEPGDLGEAEFHNTIRGAESGSNMRRLSKFLWGGHPITLVHTASTEEQVECRATAEWPDGRVDERAVQLSEDEVVVSDESSEPFVVRWNVGDETNIEIQPPPTAVVGVRAPQYGQYSEALAFEVTAQQRVTTRFDRPPTD